MIIPICSYCGQPLVLSEPTAPTSAADHDAPLLYLGVECVDCKKIACFGCQGLPTNKPCLGCAGRVGYVKLERSDAQSAGIIGADGQLAHRMARKWSGISGHLVRLAILCYLLTLLSIGTMVDIIWQSLKGAPDPVIFAEIAAGTLIASILLTVAVNVMNR